MLDATQWKDFEKKQSTPRESEVFLEPQKLMGKSTVSPALRNEHLGLGPQNPVPAWWPQGNPSPGAGSEARG